MYSLFSSNSWLCDGWGKYSGILNSHQDTSRMGGKFFVLSLHTFCCACLWCILYVGLWCGVICGTCLVVCAQFFFVWLRSLFSPNSCLCDGWGKYSGILNCHQEVSHIGGKFDVLLLHTFCHASLSCFPNTVSIDYVCNLVFSFLYSWSISCFLKLELYFVYMYLRVV